MEALEGRCLPAAGLATNQEFVSQVYTDLLHRAADSGGLAYWSELMDQGTTRAQVALGIETSLTNEYQTIQVQSFYQTLLKRSVDAGSLGYWELFLARHGVEQTEAAIAGSPEFFLDAGGTNTGFLALLYQDLLKRDIDASGSASFGAELSAGVSRANVALQVLSSNEFRTDLIEADFNQFLHRSADPIGLSFWVAQLNAGHSDQSVVAGIVGSPEYFTDVTTSTLPFSLTDPAWQTLPRGVRIWDVRAGKGTAVQAGDQITVNYIGYLTNGTVFDSSFSRNQPFSATLSTSDLIAGWVDGIPGMMPGGERRLDIPASLAYGSSGQGSIPPNSELVFNITLISSP